MLPYRPAYNERRIKKPCSEGMPCQKKKVPVSIFVLPIFLSHQAVDGIDSFFKSNITRRTAIGINFDWKGIPNNLSNMYAMIVRHQTFRSWSLGLDWKDFSPSED